MSDSKRALVLHLAGGSEPLVYALSDEGAQDLENRLPDLLGAGAVHMPKLADGTFAAINFVHVVAAHIDEVTPMTRVFGNRRTKAATGLSR
ncbi:hypothetical protein EV193_1011005 [Herbihabitans rhizosphaerae]|uniref:Uncharacterized protein n=1 Tax=Herbihabitans rhizosphaerae TaxID=1872711 RepID=A0A4Q7L618_9PSEU|nr:hypothetical protein [Herbihabitans rhizosphaerae]RZS45118.1 hypothetical protein EV193_1011005 [Herbihabitans rhizosphaerae]